MASLKNRLATAAKGDKPKAEALLKEGDERFARIPVGVIEPDPDQPRKNIGNIEELKASIAEHGIIQPIVVSPFGAEAFRIIAGERRFSAARELGLETVPAIIRTVEEHRARSAAHREHPPTRAQSHGGGWSLSAAHGRVPVVSEATGGKAWEVAIGH